MNIDKENLKFFIYEAKRTKEFREKCKNNKLSISEIMKEIDDDNQTLNNGDILAFLPPVTGG